MLKSIDMVSIYVSDWQAGMAWYQEQLGFMPVFQQPEHQFAAFALPGGGALLHLVGDTGRNTSARSHCSPNVSVEPFDGTLDELRSRGVQVFDVADDPEDGYRLARISDPEGNEINLYAYASAT